jgi:hypothetical protein
MKQLDIFAIPQQDPAIAAAIKRQRAIALHYCQIAIDRDRLEAEAVAKLKNKSNTRSTYQDLNP